jgi:hypothetical protein
MDVDWGPWTVLAEIASRDDPGPFVGLSSRLNASSGPQRSGGARPRNAVTVAHPYQALSAQIGMSWRICVDNLFCAILRDLEHLDAVCSEANSKSVFGLSQRTLNFGHLDAPLKVSDEVPGAQAGPALCVLGRFV